MAFNYQIFEKILNYLNLNERAKFRSVNKQFKEIIDSIQEDDLIIFERKVPIEGRFKFTNKLWYLDQCVYVTNLNLFFEQFNNKLINLKSLVIYGLNNIIDCNIDFKQLKHLELNDIQLKTSKILESPNLENLLLKEVVFKDNIKFKINKLNNCYISIDEFFKLFELSKEDQTTLVPKIKEFNYLEVYSYFNNIELTNHINLDIKHLKIRSDSDTTIQIAKKFKSIKKLDLLLYSSNANSIDYTKELNKLEAYLKNENNDLDLRIYGLKLFNKNTSCFLASILPFLSINNNEISFIINRCQIVSVLQRHHEILDLNVFLAQLDSIRFDDHLHLIKDAFIKMINLKQMQLILTNEIEHDYDNFFKCFPQLTNLLITQNLKTGLSNDFIDSLSSRCLNLQYLKFYCFQPLDFDFLFKLNNLKCLILVIYYPICNHTIINLIKQLKYLSFITIQFPIEDYDGLNDELSKFKQQVVSTIKSELKLDKFNFTIYIQKEELKDNSKCTILKYKYERDDYFESKFKNQDDNDKKAICDVVKFNGIYFDDLRFVNKSINSKNNLLLKDDVLIYIFKNFFNLNERMTLRLVSYQFKRIIDLIKINKLIVFVKRPPLDYLGLNNEKFSLNDSVYVYDLDKFLNTKCILNSIKNIKKLVIFGYEERYKRINLKLKFNNLVHLEINDTNFSTSTIFKSPNLKYISLFKCDFIDDETFKLLKYDHDLPSNVFFDRILGFSNLKSKLKILSLNHSLPEELDFFKECTKYEILSELEVLDCRIETLETLEYICKTYTKLKILNFSFINIEEMDFLIRNNLFDKIIKGIRKELTVNLLGCKLTEETLPMIRQFFIHYKSAFKFDHETNLSFEMGIILVLGKKWNEFNTKNIEMFEGFFKSAKSIIFEDAVFDCESILNKINKNAIESTYYVFRPNDLKLYNLPNTFKMFPKIKRLSLNCLYDVNYGNSILDMIPLYCENLIDLSIDNYDKFNFEFLINLPLTIKTIFLNTKFPIEQELFIRLIKKYSKHHLSFFSNFFKLTAELDNSEQLKQFIREVIILKDYELKLVDTDFIVDIKRTGESNICRYVFKRNCKDDLFNQLDPRHDELEKMAIAFKLNP